MSLGLLHLTDVHAAAIIVCCTCSSPLIALDIILDIKLLTRVADIETNLQEREVNSSAIGIEKEVPPRVAEPCRSPHAKEEGELSPEGSPDTDDHGLDGQPAAPLANGLSAAQQPPGESSGAQDMPAQGAEEREESEAAGSSSVESDTNSEAGQEDDEHEEEGEHEEEEEDEEAEEGAAKGESEGEADGEGGADAEDVDREGASSPSSPDRWFSLCKPLAPYAPALHNSISSGRLFYGNDVIYILFRLHQVKSELDLMPRLAAELKPRQLSAPVALLLPSWQLAHS